MKNKILAVAALCTAAAGMLTGCSDFLSEYSQDMIVAKKVEHFNEVLLGEVYLPSQIREWGVSGTAVAGFLNILDDFLNQSQFYCVSHLFLPIQMEIYIQYHTLL